MKLTKQQQEYLGHLLVFMTDWETQVITYGEEMIVYCDRNGKRCSTVLSPSGSTYFNGKWISDNTFCDVLSAWVCGAILEETA